jgi:ERF superfamily
MRLGMMPELIRPLTTSPTIAAIAAALAKAQAAFLPIRKDKTAEIQTRTGGQFSYAYVDLASVFGAIRGPLAANELAVVQAVTIRAPHVTVETTLLHASGEWLASALDLVVGDAADPRSVGSAITYGRRFSLTALVGIAPADEDDDAGAAVQAPKARRQPAPPPPSPPTDTRQPAPEAAGARQASPRRLPDPETTVISDAQRKYLWTVAGEHQWPRAGLKAMLAEAFGVESSSDLRKGEFDAAMTLVRRGPKPAAGREPAEER